jgi:hypothetical protein
LFQYFSFFNVFFISPTSCCPLKTDSVIPFCSLCHHIYDHVYFSIYI